MFFSATALKHMLCTYSFVNGEIFVVDVSAMKLDKKARREDCTPSISLTVV